jgi:hypothetical protein
LKGRRGGRVKRERWRGGSLRWCKGWLWYFTWRNSRIMGRGGERGGKRANPS